MDGAQQLLGHGAGGQSGVANTNTAGIYVVQGYTGECEIENDSLEVVVHQPLAPAPC